MTPNHACWLPIYLCALVGSCGASSSAPDVDAKSITMIDAATAADAMPPDGLFLGSCGEAATKLVCTVDTTGLVDCDDAAMAALVYAPDIQLHGARYQLDLHGFDVATIEVAADNPTGYWLTLGNSPSNDGWGGDAPQDGFENDSEFFFEDAVMRVFANDAAQSQMLLEEAAAFADSGSVSIAVCDGNISVRTPVTEHSVTSPFVFQVGGDELDNQSATGLNDQLIYLGLNRTAQPSLRRGTGAQAATITFSSY